MKLLGLLRKQRKFIDRVLNYDFSDYEPIISLTDLLKDISQSLKSYPDLEKVLISSLFYEMDNKIVYIKTKIENVKEQTKEEIKKLLLDEQQVITKYLEKYIEK